MKTTIENQAKATLKITIELSDDELAKYREKAAEVISAQVQVPGFRSGKAPAFNVEAAVGKEKFFQEVLKQALPFSYAEAVKENSLEPVSRPKITVVSDYPLKYEATVALMPEVKIKDYEKIKIPKEEVTVKDSEIDDVIHELRKNKATTKPREGAVEKGDKVEIDFQGFDENNKEVENTVSKNHPLFVGDGTLVPGFEEQLIGMKVGEKKRFDVTFPADYTHAPFRKKKVTFEVELKKAEIPEYPKFDEEFIEKIFGQKVSVEEIKKRIGDDIERQKNAEARIARENKLIDELLKISEVQLSDLLVEDEVEFLVERIKSDIEGRGLSFDQYLEFMKSKNRDLNKEKETEARERLKIRFVVNELFRQKEITVQESDVDAEIERIIATYPEEQRAKIKEAYAKDPSLKAQIENNLRLQKLFEVLL